MAKESSKKRSRPNDDEKDWTWDDTLLANDEDTSLLSADVKQLLLNRDVTKKEMSGRKKEMIKMLKEQHEVALPRPYDEYKITELKIELRLRGMDETGKKSVMVQRLNGEVEGSPPAKKKRGRKKSKMFVVIYTPEDKGEENTSDPQALGIYKSQAKAHQKAIAKLVEDMEEKLEGEQDKIDKWNGKIEKESDDLKKKLQVAQTAAEEAWGSPDNAPFVVISEAEIDT